MGLQWNNIMACEFLFIFTVIAGLGFLKPPRWLMRRKLDSKFPWGYYADQIPQEDPGFFAEHNKDFLHDTGTEFGGLDGFGDYGEFSGFGELGEFGQSFFGGDAGGGGGGGGAD